MQKLQLAIIIMSVCVLASSAVAQDSTKTAPCSTPEHHQFDFWVGTWDLTWGTGEKAGSGVNVITHEMGDCVIEENFSSNGENPFVGNSLSVYDQQAGMWKQTWVDNSGGYLDFTGGMVGDSMILSRDATVKGKAVKQRMVFYDIAPDSMTWDWQSSRDGGETWKTLWQIHYKRQK